jgi:hypothetical protein
VHGLLSEWRRMLQAVVPDASPQIGSQEYAER